MKATLAEFNTVRVDGGCFRKDPAVDIAKSASTLTPTARRRRVLLFALMFPDFIVEYAWHQ
jgi:hypothetical protein